MAARQMLRRAVLIQSIPHISRTLTSRWSCLSTQISSPGNSFKTQTSMFHSSNILTNSNIINIQDKEDFEKRVLQSETPVIVDFHATWCGPCKLLGPRLEALVAAKEGTVIMAKVDIDDNEEIAYKHGVRAVPTVVAIKKGQVTDSFVGLKEDNDLKTFVNKLIG